MGERLAVSLSVPTPSSARSAPFGPLNLEAMEFKKNKTVSDRQSCHCNQEAVTFW